MRETIGVTECPVCGKIADVRLDKNGKVYTICQFNHLCKIDTFASEKIKRELRANGKSNLYIRQVTALGIEQKQEQEQENYNLI